MAQEIKKGWILIHRKLRETDLWNQERFTRGQAWIDLLLRANHEDKEVNIRGNILNVKRGQVLAAQRYLAKEWKWHFTTVTNFVTYLVKHDFIDYRKSTVCSVITIKNFSKYQTTDTKTDNRTDTLNELIQEQTYVKELKALLAVWKELTGTNYRYSLPKYRLYIAVRKEYGAPEIEKALRTMVKDPFYIGKGPRKWIASPEWLLKTGEHIERFLVKKDEHAQEGYKDKLYSDL